MNQRNNTIDEWRGMAVLLMLADHLLMVLDADWWRWGPTRFALPLFMLVSGYLWSQKLPRARPIVMMIPLAVASMAVFWLLDESAPDPLTAWLVVALYAPVVVRFPLFVLVLGFLQAVWWPLPINGYQLGFSAGFAAAGVLAGRLRVELVPWGFASLAWLGRNALRVFAWHLVALLLLGFARQYIAS